MENEILIENNSISGNGESTVSPTTDSCAEGLSPIGSSEDAYNYIINSMPKLGLYPVNYGNASGHDSIKDIEKSKSAQQVEDDIDISGNGESTVSPTIESSNEDLSPIGSTEDVYNYITNSMPKFGPYPVNYGNASGHDTIKDIEKSKNAQQVEDDIDISGNGESTVSPTIESSNEDLSPIGSTEDVYNYITNSMPKFGPYPVNYGNASGHDTIKDIEKSKNAQQVEDDIDISGNGESTVSPSIESSNEDLSPIGSTEDVYNYITNSMPKFGPYPVNYGNASGHDSIKDIEKSKSAQQVEDDIDISGNGESTVSPTIESSNEDLSPIGSTEDVYNYITNSMPKFGPYPVNYGNASGHDTIKDIEKSKNAQQVEDDIDISGNGQSTVSPTTESSDKDLNPIGSTEDVYNYITNSMPKFGPYPVNYGNASGLHDTIKDDIDSGNEEATSFPTTKRSGTDLTAIEEIEDIRSYITGSMPKFGLHPMSVMEMFGNASGHKKEKKAKKVKDAIFKAEEVKGHRGDIIDDVDKLLQFINGEEEKEKGAKRKTQVKVPKGEIKKRKQ